MASVYPHGKGFWMRVKEGGRWVCKSTPYADRGKAERYADEAQKAIDEKAPIAFDSLRGYALGPWIAARKEAGHDWTADRGRLVNHALPVLGDLRLVDVRASHVADLVRRLRFQSEPKLAPRTVRNIYTVLSALFRDAAIEGRIETSPCILAVAQLGNVVDADPEWRPGALFTHEEAEAMIGDPRIPLDRQVVYGLGLLAGLRPGEGAALRWRHYTPTPAPLGRLLVATAYSTDQSAVKRTKTRTTKTIPVHPTLAAMLEEWHAAGWAAMIGRAPGPEDLIVPLPPETSERRTRRTGEPFRGWDYTGRRWREVDLPALGWRARSVYDTRATFITLAIDDGADGDVLRDRITHTKPKRSAFEGYDRGLHWEETCREIVKLRIARPRAIATPLATASENTSDLATLSCSGGGYRTPDGVVESRDEACRSDEDRDPLATDHDRSMELLVASMLQGRAPTLATRKPTRRSRG